MLEALAQYTFLQHAFAAALLGAVAAGVVGTLVTVNRMSSLAGSVAHASFGGLGLAYAASFPHLLGALAFSLVSALGIGVISLRYRDRADTAIAAFWAIGMAAGLVLIKLAGGYAGDLMSYLFGSIMAVPGRDLLLMGLLDVTVLLFVAAFFRELLAISYDAEFSRVQGISVSMLFLLFLCVVALTVVMLIRVVGLIMVIAMLTIPPAIARMYTNRLGRMMVSAAMIAAGLSIAGLVLSWYTGLQGGAMIILLSGAVYLTVFLTRADPT